MDPIIACLELTNQCKYGMSSHGVPSYLAVPYQSKDDAAKFYAVGYKGQVDGKNILCIIRPIAAATQQQQKIPRADLVRVIGTAGDYESETEALLLHYAGIPPNTAVRRQLQEEVTAVCQRKLEGARQQLTGYTFHIDPPGCRDVDDVITIEPAGDIYRIWITISDVAEYIQAGSLLDVAAAKQGQTFYDNEGSVQRPMFPKELSEGVLSLSSQGLKAAGLSLECMWSPATTIFTVIGFKETVVYVNTSYTYDNFISTAPSEVVYVLKDICCNLNGSLTEDTHRWIELLMILYNREAAKQLLTAGRGLLRCQPAWLSSSSLPVELLFLEATAAKYIIASTEGSTYHYGLNETVYCHASSPIRRYADLVNQRVLKAIVKQSSVTAETADPIQLNRQCKAAKKYSRDLQFLQAVLQACVNSKQLTGTIIHIDADTGVIRIYIDDWKQIIKIRALQKDGRLYSMDQTIEYNLEIGTSVQLEYIIQLNKRRWKDAIIFRIM
jgi:exoribonuclease R